MDPLDQINDLREMIHCPHDEIIDPREIIHCPHDEINHPRDIIHCPHDETKDPREMIHYLQEMIHLILRTVDAMCDSAWPTFKFMWYAPRMPPPP